MNTAVGIAARAIPVLVVLAGTLVAFGAGVDVTERPGLPTAQLAEQVYYAVGLFFLGGLDLGVPTGGPTWARTVLWGTYFLGPLITTTAVAEGALRLANPRWMARYWNRDHVLVVGDGRLARLYRDVVRQAEPRRRVLRVDTADFHQRRQELSPETAHAVVLASSDDLGNLGTAWELRRSHPGLRVVAHVAELALRRGATELAVAAGVELFNTHEIAAAEIFQSTLKPHFQATAGRDVVAIVGFGRFGQTVMRHLQAQARGEVRRVVVVDRTASRNIRQYAEHAHPDPGCETIPLDADVSDPDTWARLSQALAGSGVVPIVLLSTDDDATNLAAAAGMRRRLPDARLFVRCFADSAFLHEVEREYDVESVPVERILREALRVLHGSGSPPARSPGTR